MSTDEGKEKYGMNHNQMVHLGTGKYQEQTKDGEKKCNGKTAEKNNRFATFGPLTHKQIMERMLKHDVLAIYIM
jgi:hypothetical protein